MKNYLAANSGVDALKMIAEARNRMFQTAKEIYGMKNGVYMGGGN